MKIFSVHKNKRNYNNLLPYLFNFQMIVFHIKFQTNLLSKLKLFLLNSNYIIRNKLFSKTNRKKNNNLKKNLLKAILIINKVFFNNL